MLCSIAANFAPSPFCPPSEPALTAPTLILNLREVSVSLGVPVETGVYRANGESVGVQVDGIRDGIMNLRILLGKALGVDRILTP